MSTQGGTGVYFHEPCDCDAPFAFRECWQTCPCADCRAKRNTLATGDAHPERNTP